MKVLALCGLILCVLVQDAVPQNTRSDIYVLPFVIEFDESNRKLSEEFTGYFREEFIKLPYFNVCDERKDTKAVNEFRRKGIKALNPQDMGQAAAALGGDIFTGKIYRVNGEVRTDILIYKPSERSTTIFNNNIVPEMSNPDTAKTIRSEISAAIKIINSYYAYQQTIRNGQPVITREMLFSLLAEYSRDCSVMLRELDKPGDTHTDIMTYAINRNRFSSEFLLTAHEMCHRYNHAFGMFIDAKTTIRVPRTAIFDADEIVYLVPEIMRTGRYKTYIDVKSTGGLPGDIYSLLDEFVAYYQGEKALYDVRRKWLKLKGADDVKIREQLTNQLVSEYDSYYEIKYFILLNMIHAKKQHPEIFESICANDNFRRVYSLTDAKFAKLTKDVREVRKSRKMPDSVSEMTVRAELAGRELADIEKILLKK